MFTLCVSDNADVSQKYLLCPIVFFEIVAALT